MAKERDISLDFVKTVAIFLVVTGHVMMDNAANSASTIIFNIIWALQIPLFMVISGYFGGGTCNTLKGMFGVIWKKNILFIIPFLSYFYIVRIAFLGAYGRDVMDATYSLLYGIEASAWYLFVVFILNVNLCIAQYIQSKTQKALISIGLFYTSLVLLLTPWVYVVYFVDPRLLGAKLIMYYSVLFTLGYMAKVYRKKIINILSQPKLKEIVFAISLFVFSWIVINIDLFTTPRTIVGTLPRLISAICGCYIVIYIAYKMNDSKIKNGVASIGAKYTLELYITHMMYFKLMSKTPQHNLYTIEGMLNVCFAYILMMIFSVITIYIVKQNSITDFILYGKLR